MKIQSITIKNIASITDAFIDFENGPLGSDPLFLITGDTGSGKSTILNAICLALYDHVPALDEMKNPDEVDGGYSVRNSRQLVRKGTGEALVELKFEGNDRRHYTAVWAPRRARGKADGRFTKLVRTLYCDETRELIDKTADFTARIKEVVGLTYEQFTRTTLLAQGQFAAFIKAEPNAKSDILEKITGTEIYARIGRKINELYKAAQHEHDMLSAELRAALEAALSEADKAAYTAAVGTLTETLERLGAQGAAVAKSLDWITAGKALESQLQQRAAVLAASAERLGSDEVRQWQTLATAWDATADIRRCLDEEARSARLLHDLQARMAALAQDKWHRILDGIQWRETQLEGLQEQRSGLQALVDQSKPYAPVLAAAQGLAALAGTVAKEIRDREAHERASRQLMAQAEASQAREAQMGAESERCASAVAEAQAAVDAAEHQYKKYDLSAINAELGAAVQSASTLQQAKNALLHYRRCVEQDAQARRNLDEAAALKAETDKRLARAEELLPGAREALARAEAYAEGQKELRHHIASLRQRFAESSECPLCGTKGVDLHTQEVIDEHVRKAVEAAAEAKTLHDGLLTEKAQAQTVLKAQTRDLGQCQRAAAQAARDLQGAVDAVSALVPDYASEGVAGRLDKEWEEAEKRRLASSALLGEATRASAALDGARKALDREKVRREKADKALDEQRRATKVLLDKAALDARLAEGCAAKAEGAVGEMRALVTVTIAGVTDSLAVDTAAAVAARVGEMAAAYDRDTRLLAECETKIRDLCRSIDDARGDTASALRRFGDDYQPRAVECRNLEAVIRAFVEEASRLDGEIAAETKKAEELARTAEGWFGSGDYTREQVADIARLTEEEVARLRKGVEDARLEHTKAETECALLGRQMQAHLEARPPMAAEATAESLQLERERIDSETKAATDERARCAALLRNDEEIAVQQQKKMERLEALRELRDNWAELDDTFGGGDGMKFKRIAQSWVLRVLLKSANDYLERLTTRYRLDCSEGSLSINVIDRDHLDTVRNVGYLSGGESFIVSLALALGLSAISKDKIQVDTLFIDEGFGTLDHKVLDTVIDVLNRLHSVGGRRIGIISHVQALKDRIPTQIRLIPQGANSSRVEVVAM